MAKGEKLFPINILPVQNAVQAVRQMQMRQKVEGYLGKGRGSMGRQGKGLRWRKCSSLVIFGSCWVRVYKYYTQSRLQGPKRMQATTPAHPKCKFCARDDRQLRYLLFSLYRRLKRSRDSFDSSGLSDHAKTDGNGFKQLVRILFSSLLHKKDQCDHTHYSILFANKLGIAVQKFFAICGQLSNSLAETNYQLQIIIAQIKNAAESIAEERVVGIEESGDSQESGRVTRRRGGGRREIRRQIGRRQQQKYENSIESVGMGNCQPEMKSDGSLSGQSDQPFSHFGYYLPYPILYQHNHHMQ